MFLPVASHQVMEDILCLATPVSGAYEVLSSVRVNSYLRTLLHNGDRERIKWVYEALVLLRRGQSDVEKLGLSEDEIREWAMQCVKDAVC